MSNAAPTSLIVLAITAIAGLIGLGLTTWLKSYVQGAVARQFDKELEALRSDLRVKENEIAALQSNALSGRSERQSLLVRRRFEALEKVWQGVMRLNVLTFPATILPLLKMDAVEKRAKRDPNLRKFLETVSGGDLLDKLKDTGIESERPFVPEQLWKLVSAYQGIMVYCYMRLKVAALGLGEDNFFNDEAMVQQIKEVMPHFAEYLDKWGVAGAAHLVGPLRELVFEALRNAIHSKEADVEGVMDSKAILMMVKEADRTLSKQSAA